MARKILVLDDDEEIIALLAVAFRGSADEVVLCTSGIEAAIKIFEAYYEEKPFHALVLDCALPRLDGFTLARIVRTAEAAGVSKPARIGYFTAFAKTVDRSTLLDEVGAEAYWRKPEDTQNLPALINMWLEEGEPVASTV